MAKIIRHGLLARAGAAVSLACGLAAASSEAATLTLQDLLNGQTVVVGHVEFGNFRNYSSVAIGGALPVDPALILVTMVADGFRLGLSFESAAFGVNPGQSKHWSFEFDGIVAGDGPPVEGVSAWIQEALFDGPGGSVTNELLVQPSGQPAQRLFVRRTYDDRTREYMKLVLSDALVSTFKTTGSAEVPLTESFSLNFTKFEMEYGKQRVVPEPATLLLMGSGVVVIARGLRKRHMRPHIT
jgi:Type VI secretion system effector, Hcp/PEP-CTERM motif